MNTTPGKWSWSWIWMKLKPAFDEIGIYGVTVVAVVVVAPVIEAAIADQIPTIVVHWWDFVIAVFIAFLTIAYFEMKGTKEGKKSKDGLQRRWYMAFLGGVFWRIVIPRIGQIVAKAFDGLESLIS